MKGAKPRRPGRTSVGRKVPRKEGISKVTGAALYVDDLTFPGMLHGTTVRSTIPRGGIAGIRFEFDRSGFVVADWRDIPGRNVVALIEDDQPCLAERRVNHVAEPILLLAHEDREALPGASSAVAVDYRPEEPLYDPAASPRVFKSISIEKGSLARGFSRADLVVEGEYRTGHQEQLYIEPNGVIAVPVERRDHGLRIAPVPVLRPQGARRPSRAAAGESARSCRRRRAAGSAARKSIRR